MNATAFDKFLAIASRRELTAAEIAELHALLNERPDLKAVWQEEEQLNRLLRKLPEPPVSTNFTARVLERVQKQPVRRPSVSFLAPLRALWQFRYALRLAAVVLLGAVVIGVHQRRAANENALRSWLAALPADGLAEVELWSDFEAIRHLPSEPLPSIHELADALK
jgi:anti-sigma factor RsiW